MADREPLFLRALEAGEAGRDIRYSEGEGRGSTLEFLDDAVMPPFQDDMSDFEERVLDNLGGYAPEGLSKDNAYIVRPDANQYDEGPLHGFTANNRLPGNTSIFLDREKRELIASDPNLDVGELRNPFSDKRVYAVGENRANESLFAHEFRHHVLNSKMLDGLSRELSLESLNRLLDGYSANTAAEWDEAVLGWADSMFMYSNPKKAERDLVKMLDDNMHKLAGVEAELSGDSTTEEYALKFRERQREVEKQTGGKFRNDPKEELSEFIARSTILLDGKRKWFEIIDRGNGWETRVSDTGKNKTWKPATKEEERRISEFIERDKQPKTLNKAGKTYDVLNLRNGPPNEYERFLMKTEGKTLQEIRFPIK
jgi:hypothetical protein